MIATLARLRAEPVAHDVVQRARQPILESFENTLKTNGGWMSYTARAQSEPDRIPRFLAAQDRYLAVSAEDLRALAERFLDPAQAVVLTVLPEAERGE